MSKIFLSYSHKDESLRDELETHLALLKHQGLISTWHDRKILAGSEFESEIDENIEDSDIILLLISPYFIASDYCYDIEMKRALDRHDNGEARVIPIILEHCDWHKADFGKLLALPNDGRPVTDYPNPHKAFAEIVKGIRLTIEKSRSKSTKPKSFKNDISKVDTSFAERKDPQRSSNLRVKKRFTDKDKDDFLRDSFDYIYKFFKNSLEELEDRNHFIDTNIERVDSQTFTAKVYKEEKLVNQCKVWRGAGFGSSESIKYSNKINERNSYNMSFSVQNDGYNQYLELSGLNTFLVYEEGEDFSKKGAAEQMWSVLIEPLQR